MQNTFQFKKNKTSTGTDEVIKLKISPENLITNFQNETLFQLISKLQKYMNTSRSDRTDQLRTINTSLHGISM